MDGTRTNEPFMMMLAISPTPPVDDFVKKSSIIQYSPAALKNDARAVVQIATHEGLWAHARSVALRLKALLDAEQASVAGSAAAGVEDGEARGE